MNEAIKLRLVELRKSYGQGAAAVQAVDGVDLDVRQGELLTLLGPSGCGKSTTLRMVAGLERATSGRIELDGRDVTDVPAQRRDVATVFQSYALFPHLRIWDNIAFGLRVRHVDPTACARRVAEVIALTGLAGLERRYPNELSGGQQQRVALARSLVIGPSVLLLDEPLSNLDAKLRVQLRAELRRLQESVRFTAVYVTHDQEEALSISDRIAVMHDGSVEQVGTPRVLYARPATPFVASFMGRAHFVPAVSSGDGEVRVLGTAVSGIGRTAVLRPEAVLLTRIGSSDVSGAARARVVGVTYLGARTEYQVRLADGTELTAAETEFGASPSFPVGEEVAVRVRADAVALLP